MFIQKLNDQIHKHALDWSEIERKLVLDEMGKQDIETDDLHFEPDGSITVDGITGYRMQEGSENQIISRFVPKGVQYLRSCIEEPSLFAQNMNHWAYKQLGKKYLVRTRETLDGQKYVRAILSDRYAIMDHMELFEGIQNQFRDEFVPVNMALNAAQFHLRLAHREGRDISRYDTGDLVHGGLHFSNSEIGIGALLAQVITYRLVCTNGMLSPDELSRARKRHLGNHQDMKVYLQRTLKESGALMEEVLQLLDRSQQMGFHPMAAPPLVQYLGDRFKWSQPLRKLIDSALMFENKNAFGLIQAMTAVARNMRPDERLQLEKQAGSLLQQDVPSLAQLALAEAKLAA